MSFTPANAPLLAGLLGDRETAAAFSVEAEWRAILRFEAALAHAQAAADLISQEAAYAIAKACESFQPDMANLTSATVRDGMPVPELVRQLRAAVGEPHGPALHLGSTSQDAIDTALMLRLKPLFANFCDALDAIVVKLDDLSRMQGGRSLMARTRMRDALPISMAHKVAMWRDPLLRLLQHRPTNFPVQLGGPEGALIAMGEAPEGVVLALAARLDLSAPITHWQTHRWPLQQLCGWAFDVTTALGKIGADMAIMAQDGIGEIAFDGAGGSSAMPHKQNPILAESLVTLARFSAVQMGGLHQAALHENERSGSAWALEWLLVPQIMVATGAALRNAGRMIDTVQDPALDS